MMCEKLVRLRRCDSGDGLLDMVAAQRPDGRRVELLRSADDPTLEQCGDKHQGRLGFAEVSVQTGERDGGLPGMLCFTADRGHQPGAAGNRLSSSLWAGQPDEQTPPVVDQRHGAGRQLAAVQVVGSKAAPVG